MAIKILMLIAGIVILIFALSEFIAQTRKIIIKIGPITYGPIPKIQIGSLTIYFKGKNYFIFIISLVSLIILGFTLILQSILNL